MIAPQLLISGTVCPDLVFQFEVDPTEKPIDVAKGNGRIFYEVVNRGRKLRQNERDPRVTPSDPSFEYFVVARAGVTATSPNQIVIHRPAGFDGGAIYEFTYPARHPVVMGVAFASTRDVVSFLRWEDSDALGNPNRLASRGASPPSVCR